MTMKVAVYYNNNDIRIEERDVPELNSGEILVKSMISGICGTDLMEWYRIQKDPRVLGHEMTGHVVKSRSPKFKEGDRIFASHHVPCNKCKYCIEDNHTACETLRKGNYDPGGFSQYIRVPEINVENGTYILPDNVTYEQGSLIEPLACSIRAMRIADVKKNNIVLILGAGIAGLLNLQIAKLKGAKTIVTDINEYRLQKAKEFGADEVYNAANIPDNLKADKIVLCTGAMQAVEQAFKHVDKKGVVILFAIPKESISLQNLDFWRNEISLIATYGAAPCDLEQSLQLIKDKKVNVSDLITHRFSIEDIQEGFKTALQAKNSLKVVIIPN